MAVFETGGAKEKCVKMIQDNYLNRETVVRCGLNKMQVKVGLHLCSRGSNARD